MCRPLQPSTSARVGCRCSSRRWPSTCARYGLFTLQYLPCKCCRPLPSGIDVSALSYLHDDIHIEHGSSRAEATLIIDSHGV